MASASPTGMNTALPFAGSAASSSSSASSLARPAPFAAAFAGALPFAGRAPAALRDRIELKGARLIYPLPSDTARERLSLATSFLAALG